MAQVVVVGSLNEDQTLIVADIPRPGETVLASRTQRSGGGKGANQAVAAARAGASVRMVGRLGADDAGSRIRDALAADGIDHAPVAEDEAPTGIAVVTVAADGENAIVVAPGANAEVSAAQVREALSDLARDDIVVAQGEIPVAAIEAALTATAEAGARSVLNLAPVVDVDLERVRPDVLIVNEHEAADVAAGDADEDPEERVADLASRFDCTVVITLGSAGTILAVPGSPPERLRVYEASAVVDTTGAGDAFVGAFAAALAAGHDPATAIRWGAAAGSIAVGAAGAQGGRATPEAIQALIGGDR